MNVDRRALFAGTALVAGLAGMASKDAEADTLFTSFAFPGTGSPTSRTTPDRIADIFNVKEYGAVGDGSHDDTSAINAAVTAASNSGIIFFPKGDYKTTSAILVPTGSSLIFRGEGNGSFVGGNFNGFIFDNLSTPYSPAGAVSIIEQLDVSNSFTGNNFSVTANGTWSSSGSPVNITLSGSNPGVAAGGALFINGDSDSRVSNNSLFVGMITSVASWPTVTVSSAAVGSGGFSNLALHVVQCYAAGASFLSNASTITMATSPPAGIGTGQYYVYDYEYFLSDVRYNTNIGVATWSGITLTFTAGTGSVTPSIGSTDRLWLAPVAGCVRYSSVVGATVRDCTLSGFIGVTDSEDKIVANDPTLGAAQGFEIAVERCNFANPSGCSAVPGQTGIIIQNNSLSYYNSFNSMWCSVRVFGVACSVIGGRMEEGYFGVIIGGDFTSTINTSVDNIVATLSMESNLLGLHINGGGNVNVNAVGIICNSVNPVGGIYINATGRIVFQNSSATGNLGSSYSIYIADVGTGAANIVFVACSGQNNNTPSQGWRIPAQAWWGTCIQCDNPALVYTFANLPTGSGSPTPTEGDEYNISDGTNGLNWGDTVTNTGTHTTHYKVRWNGSNWTAVGK